VGLNGVDKIFVTNEKMVNKIKKSKVGEGCRNVGGPGKFAGPSVNSGGEGEQNKKPTSTGKEQLDKQERVKAKGVNYTNWCLSAESKRKQGKKRAGLGQGRKESKAGKRGRWGNGKIRKNHQQKKKKKKNRGQRKGDAKKKGRKSRCAITINEGRLVERGPWPLKKGEPEG